MPALKYFFHAVFEPLALVCLGIAVFVALGLLSRLASEATAVAPGEGRTTSDLVKIIFTAPSRLNEAGKKHRRLFLLCVYGAAIVFIVYGLLSLWLSLA